MYKSKYYFKKLIYVGPQQAWGKTNFVHYGLGWTWAQKKLKIKV